MSPRAVLLGNLIVSQVGWVVAVTLAAAGHPGWASAALAVCVTLQLSQNRGWRAEALLVIAAMAVGAVWDSVLTALGVIVYPPGQWSTLLAPHWIIGLWGLFATTLNVSMRWLHGRWGAAAVFGAVGGPLSFAGGVGLGAARFPEPVIALCALAAGWAAMMPLLVWIAMRLDQAAAGRRAVVPRRSADEAPPLAPLRHG